MKRKVVLDTLNGLQTIEGLTVAAVRALLAQVPDDAVCVFMFEITPTVRKEMSQVDLMIMPAHQVHGSDKSDVCCFVGPEIENARFEHHCQNTPQPLKPEVPPVDRQNVCTTSGEPVKDVLAAQKEDPDTGQHKAYLVLCDEERAKGFVRPVRSKYIHVGAGGHEVDPNNPAKHGRVGRGCGVLTQMGRALSETYARDPEFYGSTFCAGCNQHFPVEEFVWEDGSVVGS